jgi:mannosylfructose-phosphate synthase
VDIWTRRFEDQPEVEPVCDRVRILRARCGGREFISKEYLCERIPEWSENALRMISRHGLAYEFIDSHYWDAGLAGQHMAEVLGVPHLHTPHSLGIWKKRQMEADYPDGAARFEKQYNFSRRITTERLLYGTADLVLATTPQQLDILTEDYEVPAEKCPMIPPGYDDNGSSRWARPRGRASASGWGSRARSSSPSGGWRGTRATISSCRRSSSWRSAKARPGSTWPSAARA